MHRTPLWIAIVLAAVVCLAVGCGKTESDKAGKSGAGDDQKLSKPAKELLVGTWVAKFELDDAKIDKMIAEQETPDDKKEEGRKFLSNWIKNMKLQIELKADGTLIRTAEGQRPKPEREEGTWKVTSEDGMTIKLDSKENKRDKVDKVTLVFSGDDEFTFDVDDPKLQQAPFKTPIVFTRKK